MAPGQELGWVGGGDASAEACERRRSRSFFFRIRLFFQRTFDKSPLPTSRRLGAETPPL